MFENDFHHPLLQAEVAVKEKAAANLGNLQYYATLDGKALATTTYQDSIRKILYDSLKALGLKSTRKNSRIFDGNEDFSLNRIAPDKDVNKVEPDIIELILSKSGAEKLARAGVKSEVLQTFIPLEERKQTSHAERLR